MQAFSEATNTHYDSWDDLVRAESNGYVVVAIIENGRQRWPWIIGPFEDRSAAERARDRTRTKMRRQVGPGRSFSLFVRPTWKGDR